MILLLAIICGLLGVIAMILFNIQNHMVHQSNLLSAICAHAEAPHREYIDQMTREYARDQS